MISESWVLAPDKPGLKLNTVQVWCIPLNLPLAELQKLEEYLSVDELERANRFRFQVHRDRFIAARGGLRIVLGRYLDVPAKSLRFRYNSFGKPALDLSGEAGIEFNLSHSHELGLVAVTCSHPVGVDIEYMRVDLADEQIARRFFSKHELEELLSLPLESRKEGFFNCWTRKEAFIKAIGEGLTMPLDRFDVSLTPGQPAVLRNTRPNPAQVLQWNLFAVNPEQGYVGAVAVSRDINSIDLWEWHP